MTMSRPPVDVARINERALQVLPRLCRELLPAGAGRDDRYLTFSPYQDGEEITFLEIDLLTSYWTDEATGDTGKDVVSLIGHLFALPRAEAALRLAHLLGICPG